MLKEYYEIVIKDNNLAIVYKADYDEYKELEYTFDYVYHTEKGETYPLEKDLTLGRDILLVDSEHLYELLDDLKEQGFCDTIEFTWIEDYSFEPYKAF